MEGSVRHSESGRNDPPRDMIRGMVSPKHPLCPGSTPRSGPCRTLLSSFPRLVGPRIRDKEKKPFANLDGRAIWLRTAEHFVARHDVCQCIMVIGKDDQELVRRRYGANLAFMNVQIVEGGAERFDSVANALKLVKSDAELVAIHDAVRPCLTDELINAVFTKAAQTGAALLALPVGDTVKRVDDQHRIQETLPRKGLWLAQTPQVFRRDWLEAAYASRGKLGRDITDDAQLVEALGHAVTVVEGTRPISRSRPGPI